MSSRRKGEFLGGAIAPGLNISAEALFARAARLPRVEIKRPAKIIGTNTVDNLQIGLFYGHIGLVDSILERMIAELGAGHDMRGDWRPCAPDRRRVEVHHPVNDTLTLEGLRIIYARNAREEGGSSSCRRWRAREGLKRLWKTTSTTSRKSKSTSSAEAGSLSAVVDSRLGVD